MRTSFCAATGLLFALGTSAWAAPQGATKIAQASTESSASPTTPAPAAPPATATPSAPATAPAAAAPPAAPAAVPAAPAAPAPKLVGVAAWSQLIGNSITGSEGGKTLTEYYAADGTAKSMSGNDISTGTWALAGEVICFKYTDEPKPECYKLEVSGDTATMYDEKGSGTRYQILKGNPKGL